jgi:hypothetical protein
MPPPREPSPKAKSAALKVRQQHASTIWDRSIGGTVTLRGSTKHHWETLLRKGIVTSYVARRVLREVPWPDDVTPLERVASEEQIKAILDSGYGVLENEDVG